MSEPSAIVYHRVHSRRGSHFLGGLEGNGRGTSFELGSGERLRAFAMAIGASRCRCVRDGWVVNINRAYRMYREMGVSAMDFIHVEILEEVGRQLAFPKAIRVDRGTEFVSRAPGDRQGVGGASPLR